MCQARVPWCVCGGGQGGNRGTCRPGAATRGTWVGHSSCALARDSLVAGLRAGGTQSGGVLLCDMLVLPWGDC